MSKNKTKKSKSFEFNRKSIILLIIISIAGIVSGYFVGGFFIGANVPDYSLYTEASLRDDMKSLSNKAQGKLPNQFKAYEIFEIAEYRMFTHGSVYITSLGGVDTIASQKISGIKAFENGVYFKESISKGIKNVGERLYYEGNDKVTRYEAGSVNDDMVAKYKAPTDMTIDEFLEMNGVPADSFIAYIVSSKTVLNLDTKAQQITLDDGSVGYQFELQLQPVFSVINYVKQMKSMSQLPNYPAFTDITLDVIVDEQFRFVSIEVLEHYTVNYMGVNAKCTGTLVDAFEYGKQNIIPETVVA